MIGRETWRRYARCGIPRHDAVQPRDSRGGGRRGPSHLLFGTDLNFIDPAFIVGGYVDAAFTPDERQMFMYDNARRVFSLCPPIGLTCR
jgi:hypothetical protein